MLRRRSAGAVLMFLVLFIISAFALLSFKNENIDYKVNGVDEHEKQFENKKVLIFKKENEAQKNNNESKENNNEEKEKENKPTNEKYSYSSCNSYVRKKREREKLLIDRMKNISITNEKSDNNVFDNETIKEGNEIDLLVKKTINNENENKLNDNEINLLTNNENKNEFCGKKRKFSCKRIDSNESETKAGI